MNTLSKLLFSGALLGVAGLAQAATTPSEKPQSAHTTSELTAQDHRQSQLIEVEVVRPQSLISDYRVQMREPSGRTHTMRYKAMPLGTHNG